MFALPDIRKRSFLSYPDKEENVNKKRINLAIVDKEENFNEKRINLPIVDNEAISNSIWQMWRDVEKNEFWAFIGFIINISMIPLANMQE
ncbi:hypothetical protein M0804_008958 [Polistes exclamans]|nr:hypothetical protein M0804_008958 [Polistes exclamans]